jgi:hypothetical protein
VLVSLEMNDLNIDTELKSVFNTMGRDDYFLLIKKLQTCILITSRTRDGRYHASVFGAPLSGNHSPIDSQGRIIVVHTG